MHGRACVAALAWVIPIIPKLDYVVTMEFASTTGRYRDNEPSTGKGMVDSENGNQRIEAIHKSNPATVQTSDLT